MVREVVGHSDLSMTMIQTDFLSRSGRGVRSRLDATPSDERDAGALAGHGS
jgi:hypothetical protein